MSSRSLPALEAAARALLSAHPTPVQVGQVNGRLFLVNASLGMYPQLLQEFTQKVVPILQDRGLFRTEYTGSTLRDHFGLSRPDSLYGAEAQEEAHVV